MGTTREMLLLFAGVAIGGVSGYSIAAATGGAPEKVVETASVKDAVAPVPSASFVLEPPVADASFASERALRVEAEKERDALKVEIARVKSDTAPLATGRGRGRFDRFTPLPPEDAARRLLTIGADVDAALEKKDARGALALMGELSRLGRPGWPLIAKLALARYEGEDDDDTNGTQQVRGQFLAFVGRGGLRDMGLETLLDTTSPPELRRLVAEAGDGLTATPDEAARLVTLLKTETNPEVIGGMVGVLVASHAVDPTNAVSLVQAQPNAGTRRTLVEYLANSDAPGMSDALTQIAQSDPDAAVQKTARLAAMQMNPTVQGYLVTDIVPSSQAAAAGIQPGDVIVSYNGAEVKSERQLARLKTGVTGDTVQIGVWRDGTLVQMPIKAGQIGVNGNAVKPH